MWFTHLKFGTCFQNYTLEGLDKHTDYLVTVSAKNLKGLGPEDSIELRTEDGGKNVEQNLIVS